MSRVLSRSATLAPRERVAALQRAGLDVISLVGGGAGRFDLPEGAKEEIIQALMSGPLGPTDSRGLLELREALSEDLRQEKGVQLDPDRIVVTVGAKEATMATFLALLETDDEVLLPDPAWVGYEPWIRRAGAVPVRFPMGKAQEFTVDWDALGDLITDKTRLLVLTNPHNPTGALLTSSDLARLKEVLAGTDVLVISDESNCRIVFDGLVHITPLQDDELAERTILIRSFSKSFAMPGWRIGFLAATEPHLGAILAAHEHAVSCVPTLVQIGALAALRSSAMPEVIERMLDAFNEQRILFIDALNGIAGVTCHLPNGAYNAFPDFSELGITSDEISELLLDAGVATVPGSAFGALGEGHLRLAFTLPAALLLEAASRIDAVCRALPGAV